MDIRDYNEETFDDAQSIVKARFGERACLQLRRLLANPLRSLCPSAGDIAYRDGKPLVFQAAILKRLFLGQTEMLGISGAMFCKMPKAPLRYVLAVSERTNASRAGSQIAFGNTAMPVSTGIAMASDDTVLGPDSCAHVRFGILRLGGFMNFVLHGKIPRFLVRTIDCLWLLGTKLFVRRKKPTCVRRIMSLDEVDVDSFWKKYLEGNRGIVCSRTKEELNWSFGEGLKSGAVHFLAFVMGGEMLGYVAIRCQDEETLSRWMVVDWIALGDDRQILEELLIGVKEHLRSIADAIFVEMIGYPMAVQDVISRVLPYCRKALGNSFSYRIDNEELRLEFERVKDQSWFFGAYDGDRCLS